MDFLVRNSDLLLEKSMNFLWTKQAAISDNIVNAETPGYRTKVVTFEETLRSRLEHASDMGKSPRAMRSVVEQTGYQVKTLPGVTRMDDNGVNVTEQNVELIRNAYQLQYTMNAISSDLATLRTAVSGQ